MSECVSRYPHRSTADDGDHDGTVCLYWWCL